MFHGVASSQAARLGPGRVPEASQRRRRDAALFVAGQRLEAHEQCSVAGVIGAADAGCGLQGLARGEIEDRRSGEADEQDRGVPTETQSDVSFGSSHALLGEVLPTLRQDGPRMLGLAVLGVLLTLGLLARPLRRGAIILLTLGVAFACTAGVMALIGLRVNMFNLLVLPVGFGIAIDGAIYVAWHLRGDGPVARSTFRAVLFSTLTTLTAFGALVMAHHPGLASIGALAIVAMSTATFVNLVWLPALTTVIEGEPRADSSESSNSTTPPVSETKPASKTKFERRGSRRVSPSSFRSDFLK